MGESLDLIERYQEFFEENYEKEIAKFRSLYPSQRSFYFSFADLERFDHELADSLINEPDKHLAAAKEALLRIVGEGFGNAYVRIFDVPESGTLIQDVGSEHIQKLLCVQCVVTKRAEMRPRVQMALFRCSNCEAIFRIPIDKGTRVPTICANCRRKTLELDENASYFVDIQRAEVQELLERVRGGAPAGTIEVLLEGDLVNTIVPGDTIELVGIMRIRPLPKGRQLVFGKFLDALHIRNVQREFEELELTEEDVRAIRAFAARPDAFETLASSIAPSIYGYREIKEALALQLFGGTPDKTLPEGGRIRSDIHILLIGDPGVSKTKLLQYMADLAPKSIYVSGKSVTSVGLTASAERDESGEGWTLKAGALVLASGGLGMIDEFDHIPKEEMAALHEIMESQQLSIAKAGIVARFKARTSILAAANPKFGRFDPNQLVIEQFDIPPTILSRFDLIFPIKDVLDEERDRRLAQHILTTHREAASREKEKTRLEGKVLSADFIRKYVAYARRNMRPVLSHAALKRIEDYYLDLRKLGAAQGAVAITPRQLEGLVRLAEAHAKARLSESVDLQDAEKAIYLVDYMLKQVAFDRVSQRIDIDMITSGVGLPRSKAEQYYEVLTIIRTLAKESELIDREELITQTTAQGIPEVTARKLIDEMLRKGELFEPKPGYVQLVQRSE